MNKCSIYDNSLRFSRATYGIMVLISFFTHNQQLLLITSILMVLGIFSIKLNIPYQFHSLIIKKILNDKSISIQKESGELNFVAGMTATLLFVGFLLIHYGKYVNFAWIYVLIVDFLIFLACFVGFCIATLMYVFFKKAFIKK
jgi:hypothetical protein